MYTTLISLLLRGRTAQDRQNPSQSLVFLTVKYQLLCYYQIPELWVWEMVTLLLALVQVAGVGVADRGWVLERLCQSDVMQHCCVQIVVLQLLEQVRVLRLSLFVQGLVVVVPAVLPLVVQVRVLRLTLFVQGLVAVVVVPPVVLPLAVEVLTL